MKKKDAYYSSTTNSSKHCSTTNYSTINKSISNTTDYSNTNSTNSSTNCSTTISKKRAKQIEEQLSKTTRRMKWRGKLRYLAHQKHQQFLQDG